MKGMGSCLCTTAARGMPLEAAALKAAFRLHWPCKVRREPKGIVMLRLSIAVFSVSVFLSQSGVKANPKTIMDDFNPMKFKGKWWVDSFSQAIYGDTDRCAHFTISKDHDNVYKLNAEYVDTDNELVEMSVKVQGDERHPARFILQIGGDVIIETAIIDTDYDNWAIVWAKSGTVAAYHVVTRKPNAEDQFLPAIQNALDKEGLKKEDFKKVPNMDCSKKDTI